MPLPLFGSPITTIQPWKILEGRLESSSRLKGTSSLLVSIRKYIRENIQKRMSLILETWELENNEEFYKGAISTFIEKFSSVSEFRGKEEDLPSIVRKN